MRYIDKGIDRIKHIIASKGDQFPHAIIIGTQKAATTSLFDYLTQHPQVVGSFKKELHFFDDENQYQQGASKYKNSFPKVDRSKYLIEATPSYLYHSKVPERIKRYSFEPKLICVLRDPIDRAYSAYNMYTQLRRDPWFMYESYKKRTSKNRTYNTIVQPKTMPTFEQLVRQELKHLNENNDTDYEPALLRRGFYSDQINRWLAYFEKDRFIFHDYDSLQDANEMERFINDILGFISDGAITSSFEPNMNRISNRRNYSTPLANALPIDLFESLRRLFKIKNESLQELVNLNLSWTE